MTTVQSISQQTGATTALVKKVSKDIIGNRHRITTTELHTIINIINDIEEETQNIMYIYDGKLPQEHAESKIYAAWKGKQNDSITESVTNL